MLDVDALSTMIADIVSDEVGKAVAPLHAKIGELEAKPAGVLMDEVKAVAEIMISDAFVVRPAQGGTEGNADLTAINETIAAEVAKAVTAIPVPKNGENAAGIVEALKDNGELVLTLQDGRLIRTGIRDGKDGSPGKDGFSLSDFDANVSEDGRTILLSFEQESDRFEVEMKFPVPIYRGVFKEGEEYEAGDMATWGGSLWHCDEKTTDKPDAGPWRLCVKKGRDGRDAKNG